MYMYMYIIFYMYMYITYAVLRSTRCLKYVGKHRMYII